MTKSDQISSFRRPFWDSRQVSYTPFSPIVSDGRSCRSDNGWNCKKRQKWQERTQQMRTYDKCWKCTLFFQMWQSWWPSHSIVFSYNKGGKRNKRVFCDKIRIFLLVSSNFYSTKCVCFNHTKWQKHLFSPFQTAIPPVLPTWLKLDQTY